MKARALVFAVPLLIVAACTDMDTGVTAPEVPVLSTQACELGMPLADANAEIAALRAEIDVLESAGALNSGQARALRNHLDNARRHLENGRACPAQAQLRAFREQVGNFVISGVLLHEDATPLLDGADRLLGDRPPPIVWSTISAGQLHTCGLIHTGAAYCWGRNDRGQLGDGTTTSRLLPAAVAGAHSFVSITSGNNMTCALKADGTAWCWGNNGSGRLGVGTTEDQLEPARVLGDHRFTSLGTGSSAICGVRTDGAALCWGLNGRGQIGDGTTQDRPEPTPVAGGHTFAMISIGNATTCGVGTDGLTRCWGANDLGKIGDGTTGAGTDAEDRHVPTVVSGGHTFTSVSVGIYAICGVRVDGAGYCWGSNERASIGDGSNVDRAVPTSVSGGHAFASVRTGGGTSCGITPDAAAWCWGANGFGQVGDGTAGPGDGTGVADRDEPSAVVGGHRFALVSVGLFTTCGVRTDGGGYCWGRNDLGTIGDGTTTHRSRPTLIGGGKSLP